MSSTAAVNVRPEQGGAYLWYRHIRAEPTQLQSLDCDSPLLAQIVLNRGFSTADEAQAFLQPSAEFLRDPFLMLGMQAAVDRLVQAIESHEPIAVYGDYDVDGITASSVLCSFLREIDVPLEVFIPHRYRDGYGLNHRPLNALADGGASLIVTVDCGITAVDEVAAMTARGIDMVITDHHLALTDIPAARAVINPHQPGCPYPFKSLAGAGVAYKLVLGIADRLNTERARLAADSVIDLVALGTMADVVPLVDENRVIVSEGLARMRRGSSRPGIESLARVCRVDLGKVTSESLAFYLAPRINAAGRLGDAREAFDLLMSETSEQADALAESLNTLNRTRQEQTETWVEHARVQLKESPPRGVAVIAGDYPLGIAGIVAARVAEDFQVPAIVLGEVDGQLKGSARAPEPFDIGAGLRAVGHMLGRFGGHARAAGLSCDPARLDEIREALEQHFAPFIPEGERKPALMIDGLVRPESITFPMAQQLEALEPHGEANPCAVLLWRDAEVVSYRIVGAGHLSLSLRGGGRVTPAIMFRPKLDPPTVGSRIDVAFEPKREFWNDSWRLTLRVRDWRPAQI